MSDPSRTLKVAIPKGSLQEPTIELLAKAGYEIYVSSRGLRPSSNDPELDLYMIRAQEIGRYLGQGFIDCGITGYDWAYENNVELIDLGELPYSRATTRPTKWVLVAGRLFSHVISVCDEANAERCPVFPGFAKRHRWSFPDPSAVTGSEEQRLEETRKIRDLIESRVKSWCAEMCAAAGPQ